MGDIVAGDACPYPRDGAGGRPWRIIRYPLDRYPFPQLAAADVAADGVGTQGLQRLGADRPAGPIWTRATDQASAWHARFYDRFDRWRHVYDAFVADVIGPLLGEPIYYQSVPTFRVHLDHNVAVGEFHTDGQYHHPAGERTFWLPLTPACGTNSVWIEADDGTAYPVTAEPGEVAVFDAVNRRHGNRLNDTGRTRVSMDFRCLPVRRYRPSPHRSVNAGLPFAPGGYYHPEPVGTATTGVTPVSAIDAR